LRRSIDLHPHKHSRPEIGNAKRQDQKDWGGDRGFGRDCSIRICGEAPQEVRSTQEQALHFSISL
jgi:hypothetical protein